MPRTVRAILRHLPAWAATAAAAAGFAACLAVHLAGGGGFDLPWAPTLGLRLRFTLDGLGALYALLATGIGALVFAYAAAYLPLHLEHEDRPAREQARFWPWMALFAVAMVGLATAQDLILLFAFFDLTALCSYFLIGFDRDQRDSRRAALMALIVTGVSAIGLLLAAVLFRRAGGTFSIPALIAGDASSTAGAVLIAVAAMAKSAQVPLHFWLPRAMAAPTPVSAYLHSAAMVAAGVLVLGRLHPLVARTPEVLDGLLVVGFASVVVGGAIALVKDELKQVLAHSTISQYGYVVALYGMGATGAAAFYVVVHAVAKSALFMTAGAATMATGESALSRAGGLGRRMPVLAVGSGLAAATLAALPLTAGFFKDELFFKAALERGGIVPGLAVLAAALTFAYVGRFWWKLFAGRERTEPHRVPVLLVAPVALLGALAVLGGLVVEPVTRLAEQAGAAELDPAYHLDARTENLMALGAWALGGVLLLLPHGWARALEAAGDRLGPLRLYRASLSNLNRFSDAVHDREVRDLRNSLAAVLVPAGVLTGLGFLATPTVDAYAVGGVRGSDVLILGMLLLVLLAAVSVAATRTHLRMVLSLSVVGFALAAVYALVGAPDVALVAVVVETVLALVFLAALARLPRSDAGAALARTRERRRWRDPFVGVVAGVAAFATIWGFLSRPAFDAGAAERQVALAEEAHGKDVVTVILADFRGLDTLGEITVLGLAVVGVATLLRRGRPW